MSTKRHTTRENTLGVMTVGQAQIFFHDTPGFVSHEDRDDYKPALSAASREAIAAVNLTLLLVDASKDVTKRGLRSLTGLLERALRSVFFWSNNYLFFSLSAGGLVLTLAPYGLVGFGTGRTSVRPGEVLKIIRRPPPLKRRGRK